MRRRKSSKVLRELIPEGQRNAPWKYFHDLYKRSSSYSHPLDGNTEANKLFQKIKLDWMGAYIKPLKTECYEIGNAIAKSGEFAGHVGGYIKVTIPSYKDMTDDAFLFLIKSMNGHHRLTVMGKTTVFFIPTLQSSFCDIVDGKFKKYASGIPDKRSTRRERSGRRADVLTPPHVPTPKDIIENEMVKYKNISYSKIPEFANMIVAPANRSKVNGQWFNIPISYFNKHFKKRHKDSVIAIDNGSWLVITKDEYWFNRYRNVVARWKRTKLSDIAVQELVRIEHNSFKDSTAVKRHKYSSLHNKKKLKSFAANVGIVGKVKELPSRSWSNPKMIENENGKIYISDYGMSLF